MTGAGPAPEPAGCDHTSVGVLIFSPGGLLVFERATPPVGIAPVAGHVDQHGGPARAARAEAIEEVGLKITGMRLVHTGWRPNRCRRPPAGESGHRWWIYQAQAAGSLSPSAREVRTPRWIDAGQLRQYAQRTAAHAQGHFSAEEFARQPGLEPVWVRFLHDLHFVTVDSGALERIERII
ncbi:NUDIX domain-containing protein [Streptomyces sp. NPDC101062]|uniref:NUDIX domain-containing protein n=1 Tax=unclassified Streptomyces TaxID=2593676 RepID=UPI003814829A